jgi:hypothetical protein
MNPLSHHLSDSQVGSNDLPIQYEEAVLVFIAKPLGAVMPGVRYYFTNPSLRLGDIITAITVPRLIGNGGNIYNDIVLLSDYKDFTLTLCDSKGHGILWNFPVADLSFPNTAGKLRKFDIKNVDLQRSYITNNSAAFGVSKNVGMLFIFYSRD